MAELLATHTLYDGSEYGVVERPATPDGPLVLRWRLPAGAAAPPPHVHPYTVESYKVLEGRFDVMVEKTWRTLETGESASVPPGVRHTFRNESGAEVVVHNVHEPHHEFEAYIRSVAALTQQIQGVNPTSPAAAVRMALLFERHADLIQPADAPMKVGMKVLAGVGRLGRVSVPG